MSDVKFCKFAQHYRTDLKYVCYKYERCCPEGCCSTYSYRYMQTWYFWAVVFLAFGIFYLLSWYCKRVQKRMRTHALQQVGPERTASSRNNSAAGSPRGGAHRIDALLDNLIQNYRTRLTMGDDLFVSKGPDIPPDYERALNMPKPTNAQGSLQVCLNLEETGTKSEESVPSYEDATKNNNIV